VFDAEFFRTVLPAQITEKSKHSSEGVVSVELHVHAGGTYLLNSIIDASDTALVVDVYPERGPARKNPAEERKLGTSQFDMDRIAVPYSAISQVVITTRRARNDIGFHVG